MQSFSFWERRRSKDFIGASFATIACITSSAYVIFELPSASIVSAYLLTLFYALLKRENVRENPPKIIPMNGAEVRRIDESTPHW
jgi:hypothetical protein